MKLMSERFPTLLVQRVLEKGRVSSAVELLEEKECYLNSKYFM